MMKSRQGRQQSILFRQLQSAYPSKKVFTVVSILDWRSDEHRERYRQLETRIRDYHSVVTLIDGVISVTGQPVLEEEHR